MGSPTAAASSIRPGGTTTPGTAEAPVHQQTGLVSSEARSRIHTCEVSRLRDRAGWHVSCETEARVRAAPPPSFLMLEPHGSFHKDPKRPCACGSFASRSGCCCARAWGQSGTTVCSADDLVGEGRRISFV